MTREEEINQASMSYAFQLCNVCLDYDFCEKIGMVCPEFRESVTAFSEGIRWADEHPTKEENVTTDADKNK